jgi:hypothetical protein
VRMSLWKNKRMLDRGERCPARPGPAVAQRVALACATVCATILQPVDDCVLVRGRQVKKQFGPSRQEFKNIPSNATKHDIVWQLLTMINST